MTDEQLIAWLRKMARPGLTFDVNTGGRMKTIRRVLAGWTCSRGHYNSGNSMWCSQCPQ